jgi:hypothetical protein
MGLVFCLPNLSSETLMAIIQRLLAVTDVPTAGISKALIQFCKVF